MEIFTNEKVLYGTTFYGIVYIMTLFTLFFSPNYSTQ